MSYTREYIESVIEDFSKNISKYNKIIVSDDDIEVMEQYNFNSITNIFNRINNIKQLECTNK